MIMKKEIELIEEIFEHLYANGIVAYRSEFICEWLEREESYLRVLRYKSRRPSVDVFARCMDRLNRYGEIFEKSQLDEVIGKGRLFKSLAQQCQSVIDRERRASSAATP